MNITKMVLVFAAMLTLPAFAAEGIPGATVAGDGVKPPYGHHGAMREACKADQEKCRKERTAQREQWCAQNPEKCSEMKARAEQRRAQCQADPEKCRKDRQARVEARFQRADADHDGALSRAEAEKGMPRLARHFDVIDANKDGVVSRAELETARKAHRGRHTRKT